MDQSWEEKLSEILAKEPAALTPGDVEFLRARRSYLTPDQLSVYAEVLGDTVTEEEASEPKGKKKKDE